MTFFAENLFDQSKQYIVVAFAWLKYQKSIKCEAYFKLEERQHYGAPPFNQF